MIPSSRVTIGSIVLCFFLLILTACISSSGLQDQKTALNVGILIFGDGGYHLGYPDQNDYVNLFSDEQYQQDEWDDWVGDHRPEAEFEPRPSAISPVTGRTVPASGMNQVSIAMKNYCRDQASCDFGMMLGDNIYPSGAAFGADGYSDASKFKDMLADPFGSLVETPDNYLTYVTLGNHDWETSRAGGFAQIEYLEESDNFYMDGPFFAVKPPGGNGEIELFVIDTNMLLASVAVLEDRLNADGSELPSTTVEPVDYFVQPLTRAEKDMAQWLEKAMKESTARWKLVISHHPIWSSGGSKFEQARVLRRLILPTLCRYADALFAGHEHSLEIHTDNCAVALGEPTALPLVQILSGAAAKQRPQHSSFMRYQDHAYPEHKAIWVKGLVWGFAHMQIDGDTARVTMLTVPDDGSADISVAYEYQFMRRSPLGRSVE